MYICEYNEKTNCWVMSRDQHAGQNHDLAIDTFFESDEQFRYLGTIITHSLTHSPSLTPGHYNPCRVLADSTSCLQPSLSLDLILQFLTPSLSASLITPSVHLRFGLPTRLLPSGLSKVIFLHGRLSCIRTICRAHVSLVILIVVTKSVLSYRRYSSSLYLNLHIAP